MSQSAFTQSAFTHPAFATLPQPSPEAPVYAVIFASLRTEGDRGYATMAERMVELAAQQPGYLGVESARGGDGFGITVSYWSSLDAIAQWRSHAEHTVARELGRSDWYSHYALRIARVERSYTFAAAA